MSVKSKTTQNFKNVCVRWSKILFPDLFFAMRSAIHSTITWFLPYYVLAFSLEYKRAPFVITYQKSCAINEFLINSQPDNMKIMPFVEDDKVNFQPEAKSTAQSWRLMAIVIVEGWQSNVSPSTLDLIIFLALKVLHLFTLSVYVPYVHLKHVDSRLWLLHDDNGLVRI